MEDLKDTAAMMSSADYKERFLAEYYQLETRCTKLNRVVPLTSADCKERETRCTKLNRVVPLTITANTFSYHANATLFVPTESIPII